MYSITYSCACDQSLLLLMKNYSFSYIREEYYHRISLFVQGASNKEENLELFELIQMYLWKLRLLVHPGKQICIVRAVMINLKI